MPGDKKDLRDAEAGTDPVVDFNYNELLAELEKEIPTEVDERTEVCVPMLIARGMTRDQARNLVEQKLNAGQLESRPATYKGARVKAYRKVQ
jgi:hypothetical protein